MPRLTALTALASVLGAALGGGACQLVAGLDGDFKQAEGHDAGTGADAADDGGGPGCHPATYPDPPAGKDDGVSNEIVLAVRTMDLGEGSTTPPGYDLDHACTCFEDAGPTCVSAQQHCDAPGGVDSASAQLFTLIQFAAGVSTFGSAAFSQKLEKGLFSLVLRVRGYNGKADDPAVDVAIFPSPGVDADHVVWDGNDPWQISETSLLANNLDKPLYRSQGAYVAHGTLVAAMPNILAVLGATDSTISLRLTDGVITGALAKDAVGWKLTSGVLAARWAQQDIFAALSSYRDGNNQPICTDSNVAYGTAKSAICKGLDILTDGSGAASQPCDALSLGFGFTAQQAQLGSIVPPPTPSPGCPSATDPANDSCTL
jgi:hypothetical protein